MQANVYQEWTNTTAIYDKAFALEYLGLGLTSESGEVAGKIKKYIRDGKLDRTGVIAEIGDVLWYCAQLCEHFGTTLESVMQYNHDKLESRKARQTLNGSGDVR